MSIPSWTRNEQPLDAHDQASTNSRSPLHRIQFVPHKKKVRAPGFATAGGSLRGAQTVRYAHRQRRPADRPAQSPSAGSPITGAPRFRRHPLPHRQRLADLSAQLIIIIIISHRAAAKNACFTPSRQAIDSYDLPPSFGSTCTLLRHHPIPA